MQRFSRGTECDEAVRHELRAAGIDPVCGEPAVGEVISSVTGRLGAFTFRRAWCHWVADGLVPLEVALAMHADPVGRNGLRVGSKAVLVDTNHRWAGQTLKLHVKLITILRLGGTSDPPL